MALVQRLAACGAGQLIDVPSLVVRGWSWGAPSSGEGALPANIGGGWRCQCWPAVRVPDVRCKPKLPCTALTSLRL